MQIREVIILHANFSMYAWYSWQDTWTHISFTHTFVAKRQLWALLIAIIVWYTRCQVKNKMNRRNLDTIWGDHDAIQFSAEQTCGAEA
jgi:hypothetical protein